MIEYLYQILQTSQALFFLTMVVCLILGLEFGTRLGARRRAVIGERADEGANLAVGSVLGLMAFVLALNLSNASTRYEMRMHATLEEVNAIGTALMQAGAVGGDEADVLVADLKDYLVLRHRYVQATRFSGEIPRLNAETDALQGKIWGELTRRLEASTTPGHQFADECDQQCLRFLDCDAAGDGIPDADPVDRAVAVAERAGHGGGRLSVRADAPARARAGHPVVDPVVRHRDRDH